MDAIDQELAALVVLDHEIEIFIPSEREGTPIPATEREAMIERVAGDFAEWFGGATLADAVGAWRSPRGIVYEPIRLCFAYAIADALKAHVKDALELAREIKRQWAQEAIALRIDRKLYLV